MKVLISIQQPVKAWQIPIEGVERLKQRFPDITFVHATDAASRVTRDDLGSADWCM